MTYKQELDKLAADNGGKLTVKLVLERAGDPTSALHKKFTWNNDEAARKWRIYEASKLIRDYEITIIKCDHKVRTVAYVNLSSDRVGSAETNVWRRTSDVAANPDQLATAVADALAQLIALKKRYEHFTQLQEVWDAIDKAAANTSSKKPAKNGKTAKAAKPKRKNATSSARG